MTQAMAAPAPVMGVPIGWGTQGDMHRRIGTELAQPDQAHFRMMFFMHAMRLALAINGAARS
jgi:hypothetical protein